MARALHSGFDDGSNTDARRVSLDTENFTENLSDHDTNVQEALESLDKLKYVSSDFFLSKLKDVDDTNKEPNTMLTVDLNNKHIYSQVPDASKWEGDGATLIKPKQGKKVSVENIEGIDLSAKEDKGVAKSLVEQHEQDFNHNLINTAIQSETDPIFSSSPAKEIKSDDITNLSNLSGSNSGDETASGIKTKLETLAGANRLDLSAIKSSTKRLVEIASVTISSATTSFDIEGLDGDTDEIYVVKVFFVSNYAGDVVLYMRANGDDGANYGNRYIHYYDSTFNQVNTTNRTGFIAGYSRVATGRTSWTTSDFYVKSGKSRVSLNHSIRNIDGKTLANYILETIAWGNTADNITKLTFTADQANGIGVGTQAKIYTMRSL